MSVIGCAAFPLSAWLSCDTAAELGPQPSYMETKFLEEGRIEEAEKIREAMEKLKRVNGPTAG